MNTRPIFAVLAVAITILSFGSRPAAQEIEFVSSSLWSGISDIEIAGNYAFLAMYNGLVIFDISDPENPVEVGKLFCKGEGTGVAVDGAYAYLADGSGGLRIIDISNRTQPVAVGIYDNPSAVNEVCVSGNYAYTVTEGEGIVILDVANKSNPAFLGSHQVNDVRYYDIVLRDTIAYIACPDNFGVFRYNISDPGNPRYESHYNISGGFSRLTIANDDYLIANNLGLHLYIFDISDPSDWDLVSTITGTGYDIRDVVYTSGYLLISTANQSARIEVHDFSDPSSPVFVNHYFHPDNFSLAWMANYGDNLVVATSIGILTLNINTAMQPVLIGSWDYDNNNGYSEDLLVDGDYVYVADGEDGLQIVNISDPSNPVGIGNYNSTGYSWGIAKSGNYVYLADGPGGTPIIDVSDPTDPQFVSSCPGGYDFQDVAISGNYAYLANTTYGLVIYNISGPSNPVFTGHYDTPGSAWDVLVSGNYAYIADALSGVQIINISNPASPTLAGSYDTPGTAFGLALENNHLYVADESGLIILDVSNPSDPSLLGQRSQSGSHGISLQGNLALVAMSDNGIEVIDISDPSNPSHLSWLITTGSSQMITISGDLGYIADGSSGLQVIDIHTPAVPILLSDYRMGGTAYDVAVEGNYAYVAENIGGIVSLDISNPAEPIVLSRLYQSNHWGAIAVQGNYAYVAGFTNGTFIFDISDPSNPDNIGSYYSGQGYPTAIHVDGNIAYIALSDAYDWLHSVNIAVPSSPSLIRSEASYHRTSELSMNDTLLFCAGGYLGIWDFADPGIFYHNWRYYNIPLEDLDVQGTYLFGACPDTGLMVYDISDVTSPVEVTFRDLLGAEEIELMDNYAVVGANGRGLFIYDISNPSNPVQVASTDISRSVTSIEVANNLIYVTDTYSLMIFSFPSTGIEAGAELPLTFSLSPNYPNPFNAATTIEFNLPTRAEVNVAIYDILGRRVTTLLEGEKQPGHHSLIWDARDAPSGIYFARLQINSKSEVIRMMLLK